MSAGLISKNYFSFSSISIFIFYGNKEFSTFIFYFQNIFTNSCLSFLYFLFTNEHDSFLWEFLLTVPSWVFLRYRNSSFLFLYQSRVQISGLTNDSSFSGHRTTALWEYLYSHQWILFLFPGIISTTWLHSFEIC